MKATILLLVVVLVALVAIALVEAKKPKPTHGGQVAPKQVTKTHKKGAAKKVTKTKQPVKNRKYDLSKKESALFREWLEDRPEKLKKMKLSRTELINRWHKFRANVAVIRKLNQYFDAVMENEGDAEFGLTEHSDLDDDEFGAARTGVIIPEELQQEDASLPDNDVVDLKNPDDTTATGDQVQLKGLPQVAKRSAQAFPKSFDWRKAKKKVVTAVKNQGQCGSCWTFATAGNIEARWALSGHSLVALSEENILDCARGKYLNGCKGGWPGAAIDYIAQHGLHTFKKYPYRGSVTKCQKVGGTVAKVPGYIRIGKNVQAMMTALQQYGPLVVIIDAKNAAWKHYKRGVIRRGCSNSKSNHAVLLVGWTTVKGTPVWIIKNSWGKDWGMKGYVYLKRSSGRGTCGINKWPLTAT